ncbi:MAG: choice-of-anchor L domain-containing protein [Sulfuricurvum sp.]|nr:choice-of-anchor L domain-containing protein [Sulfuricurvum sp.]
MSTFTSYAAGSSSAVYLQNLFGSVLPTSQFDLIEDSVKLIYGNGDYYNKSVSIGSFDGVSLMGLQKGLILSTGSATPPLSNTQSGYGIAFEETTGTFSYTEQLANVVSTAFALDPEIEDTTAIEFDFIVSDPNVKGIKFDLVFASDEFPEYADSPFVDVGAVFINGVNYALFNNSASEPLSILGSNIAAGNFYNNENGTLAIEYDGVSPKLTITAPVVQGLNHFAIAVADTGDQVLDSALLISNLEVTGYAGNGVAPTVTPTTSMSVMDDLNGNQYFDIPENYFLQLNMGSAGGDDVIDASQGYALLNLGLSLSQLSGYTISNNQIVINTPYGIKTVVGPDIIALSDLIAAFDTTSGGKTYEALSLLVTGLGGTPDTETLSLWSAKAIKAESAASLADSMISYYAPGGISNEALVSWLYHNITGLDASNDVVQQYASQIGNGLAYETQGALLAMAAEIDPHLAQSGLVGSIQLLNSDVFWNSFG